MPSILQGRNRESKPAPKEAPADEHMPADDEQQDSGMSSKLSGNDDGSYSIEDENGQKTEHPHIGHALMHMAGKHSGGLHHHTHHDGMSHTVHTSAHGGEPESAEHDDLESVKGGMDSLFAENGADHESGSETPERESKDY